MSVHVVPREPSEFSASLISTASQCRFVRVTSNIRSRTFSSLKFFELAIQSCKVSERFAYNLVW